LNPMTKLSTDERNKRTNSNRETARTQFYTSVLRNETEVLARPCTKSRYLSQRFLLQRSKIFIAPHHQNIPAPLGAACKLNTLVHIALLRSAVAILEMSAINILLLWSNDLEQTQTRLFVQSRKAANRKSRNAATHKPRQSRKPLSPQT